jgi:hypothetical protein
MRRGGSGLLGDTTQTDWTDTNGNGGQRASLHRVVAVPKALTLFSVRVRPFRFCAHFQLLTILALIESSPEQLDDVNRTERQNIGK